MKTSLLSITSLLLTLATGSADWRTDIGWDELKLYASDSGFTLPTGDGIALEMTEADTDSSDAKAYMPDTTYSGFSGITFTNASGSDLLSSHATGTAQRFFGHTTSLLTGTPTVTVREANDFIGNFIKSTGPVESTSGEIMNHSYVGRAVTDTTAIDNFNKYITRFDFFSQNSQIINVIAMDNGGSSAIPPLWGSAYNTISVGRTDGAHSHGSTPANYIMPGRQKPDIVTPALYTSTATPQAASAIAILYKKAKDSQNLNASHADTIKACLLAGATKTEFTNWSQTPVKPLDTTFGAGELNVYNSYRIIEKSESSPGTVNFRGWSRNTTSNTTSRTYTFTTPDYNFPKFSAALIWQRDVTEGGGWFNKTYEYEDLSNLKLELLDAAGTPIQTSDSALDNVEHIWNTNLTPNTTYNLRVTSASAVTTAFSLAWRVDGTPPTQLSATVTGNDVSLTFSKLYPNILYTIQKSTDMINWVNASTFTPTSTTSSWTDSDAYSQATPVFYRLRFFAP